MADEHAELTDAELQQWWEAADGCVNGEAAGIGVQARDRRIGRLIEEVRRLRKAAR